MEINVAPVCRYTFFIVLYPMGVSGELLTIYAALPYIQKTGLYSITLPNKYNFSFDYYTFLILTMVSYIPCKCVFYCVYIVFTCSKISTLLPQTDSYWNVSPVHSVPAALLPHVAAEKEGSGSRGRVQQSGINMMPGLHTTWTEHMEERGEGGEKKKKTTFSNPNLADFKMRKSCLSIYRA